MRKKRERLSGGRNLYSMFRPSPLLTVGLVASGCMSALLFGGTLKNFFTDQLHPNITFQPGSKLVKPQATASNKRLERSVVFDGEVYRTEGRLREASAVAVAATLSGLASIAEKRPARGVADLLSGIAARGLLPPGVSVVADRNMLVSDYSTIYVRLRPTPFAVEVLSIGRERLDGPALLLRVPDEKQTAEAPARYFYSLTMENIKVPEPFSQPSAVMACGWQTDTIKPELTDGANPEHLTAWVREQKQK